MIFQSQITVSPNTSYDERERVFVGLVPATLTRLRVEFPPGCAGLLRLIIRYKEAQLYPAVQGTYFAGDTFPYEFRANFPLLDAPHELILEAWNLDNLYEHTATVYFELEVDYNQMSDFLRRVLG